MLHDRLSPGKMAQELDSDLPSTSHSVYSDVEGEKRSDGGDEDCPIPMTSFKKIEKAFLESTSLIAHQIRSFDDFLKRGIQKIFGETPPFEILPDYSPASRQAFKDFKHARVTFGKVTVTKPEWISKDGKVQSLFPMEARLRKMTYNAKVHVDIRIQVYTTAVSIKGKGKVEQKGKTGKSKYSWSEEACRQDEVCEKVFVGQIPIMVHSALCQMHGLDSKDLLRRGHCYFDGGGYFIIKGSEKVLIAQEEFCKRLWCSRLGTGRGFLAKFPNKGSFLPSSQVYVYLRYDVAMGKEKKTGHGLPYVSVRIPYFKREINAVIVFRALGITRDKDLMEILCLDVDDLEMINLIYPSLEAANSMIKVDPTVDHIERDTQIQNAALELLQSIPKHSVGNVEELPFNIVEQCLFPQLSDKSIKRAILLGYIVSSLMACSLGRRWEDSKDDLRNKRLDLAGDLFRHQLMRLMHGFCKDLQKSLGKVLAKSGHFDPQNYSFDSSRITKGFERAFSTGSWSQPPGRTGMKAGGLVVPIDRKNPMATLSHLRQTQLQVQNPTTKLGDARYPNKSHIGRICLVQTSDQKNCGLVKHLAIASHVSLGSDEESVIQRLKEYGIKDLEDISLCELKAVSKVLVNGDWVAVHVQPENLIRHLRRLRRDCSISYEVEIVEDAAQREVRIFCDSGRILRPLIILKDKWRFAAEEPLRHLNGRGSPKFMEFLEAGIVEYIGPEEEAGCTIAVNLKDWRKKLHSKDFSHCEVHPAFLFGVGASFIPFANHNHSTRVMHQSQKHGKQAIGYYTTCSQARFDTRGQNLFYPQKPLVGTKVASILNKDELSNGQNAIIAVCPFLGFNQEDSIVMNQTSIDRGLFNSMHYQGFVVELDGETETLTKPSVSDSRKAFRNISAYNKLESDGLPYIGADLFPNDIIFGKVLSEHTSGLVHDTSVVLKSVEKGRVDRVVLTVDRDEKPIARVILRHKRSPAIGDKFSSLHGQKGVVGFTFTQDDLPFTRDGIVPDIIINPHAFPSRQTIGQLLETHLGKASAVGGRKCDATPFNGLSLETIRKELHGLGYECWGKEAMIHGQTGQMLEAKIFIGPAFYQRLLKMAEDQVKYRRQGPVHPLTRQPIVDRKRHGGVRIGEMERDCLIAHGASANIRERLFTLSDPYSIHICQGCCMVATKDVNGHKCRVCKSTKKIVQVPVPYSCKWLYQELLSMGICLRFVTELD